MKVLALVCLLATSLAHAEDWTVNGRTYVNVRVTKVDDDKVHITYDGGLGSVRLADLPDDVRRRFSYDPDKAKEAEAEEQKRQAAADAQNAADLAEARRTMAAQDEAKARADAQAPVSDSKRPSHFFYGKVEEVSGDNVLVNCTGNIILAPGNGLTGSKVVGYISEATPPRGCVPLKGLYVVKAFPQSGQIADGDTISGTAYPDGVFHSDSGDSFHAFTAVTGTICTKMTVINPR